MSNARDVSLSVSLDRHGSDRTSRILAHDVTLHVGQEIRALFPKCFLERLQGPPKLTHLSLRLLAFQHLPLPGVRLAGG